MIRIVAQIHSTHGVSRHHGVGEAPASAGCVPDRGDVGRKGFGRGDGSEAFPAVPGVREVDVTGAGDSFSAPLASSLAEGENLSATVCRASYAGAYAVQHFGVIGGLPGRETLDVFQGR